MKNPTFPGDQNVFYFAASLATGRHIVYNKKDNILQQM